MFAALKLISAWLVGAAAFGTYPPEARSALIIVDTQKCFTNGPRQGVTDPFDVCNPPATGGTDTCERYGSLGVATGQSIVPNINKLRNDYGCLFDDIIRSQDYHPANHFSFASRHFGENPFAFAGGPVPAVGYPINVHCIKAASGYIHDAHCCLVDTAQAACTVDGTNICSADTDPSNPACSACAMDPASCTVMPQAMWTDHCLQDGDSDFATGLETPETDLVVQKGVNQNIDAYSVFMDNAKIHKTMLDETLKAYGIQRLFVVGIATDFCVSWTAQDAVDLGYEVYVIEDATAPIGLPVGDGMTTVDVAMGEMEAKGVKVITMDDMTSMTCPGRRKLAEEKPKGRVLELY